jgi:hypothetical protein
MTEKDEKDSKVVRLFPAKDGSRLADPPDGETASTGAGDTEAVRQIVGILGEAEPVPVPRSEGPAPPEPGHRNAVQCPQCDQYTWRMTRHCVHCGADLVAHAEARIYRRRRRWAIVGRCIIVGSWAVAAGSIYAVNHYYHQLPPKVRGVLFITVIGIVGVNLFLFWMVSQDDRRR